MPYWSKISVSASTLRNWPLTKYTPFSTWKAEPVAAAPFATVDANGLPTDMVVFPRSPEEIIALQVNYSSSENISVELLEVLDPR